MNLLKKAEVDKLLLDKNYEVCNCNNVLYKDIIAAIHNGADSLGKIQDDTNAGTQCRFCICKEGDFGKIKKRIYCKDILNNYKGDL